MSTVGSAYVVIRAISPALKKDIAKAAESAGKAAVPAIDKIGKDIDKSLGKATTRAAEKAGKAAAPAAKSAGMQIGEAMADALPGGYTKKAGAALKRGLSRAVSAAGPDKEGNNLGNRLTKGFASSISKFRIPMPVMLGFLAVPAIGGALQILGAYVAGAISLVGAMGPAFATAGGVGLASMLALGGAVGAVMLAFKTESPQLDRFKIAVGAIGKEFQTVGLAVQRALLPNLGFALANLTKTIPTLKTGLSGLGGVVGQVAINLSKVVTGTVFLQNLATVFREGGPQVSNYGSALGSVLQIVLALAAAAAPIATRFSAFIATFAAGAAKATLAGQASGRLTAFMERGAAVAAQLGGIIADLGRGLFNTFSAGSSSGQTLLDGISRIAAKFAEWTGSLEGQTALRTFFSNALPVIREVNGLIGDVLKAVVTPIATGDNAGIIGFVRALRTDVLPALSQIADAASGLGPSLVTLTTAVAGLITSMSNSGALGAFVSTLTALINAVSAFLSLPVVGDLAGFALAFGGAAKAVDLMLKPFGGIMVVARPLGNLLFGTADKIGLLSRVGTILSTRVLPALATGLRIVGTAVYGALGPVGLIIAAVVLLVGGLIYAYKHSEKFRAIVDKLGKAIMSGLGAALEWLKGVWDTVWGALVDGWNAVQSAFSTGVSAVVGFFADLGSNISSIWSTITGAISAGWGAIQGAFNAGIAFVQGILARFSGLINIITQPFQGLVTFFTGVWNLISGIFTGNIDKITTGIAQMIGGIVRFFFGMPSRVIQAIIPLLPAIWGFFVNAFVTVNNAIAAGITAAVTWLAGLPGRALAAINSFVAMAVAWAVSTWNSANAAIAAGINAAIGFMQALPGRAMAAINSLIGRARAWAASTWANVRSAFSAGVTAAVGFAQALPGRVMSAINALIAQARSWASTTWSNVRTAFSTGISNVVTTAQGLPGRVISAVGNLRDRLTQAGRDLIEGMGRGIREALTGLLSTARDLAGKVVSEVAKALKINSPSKVMIPIGSAVGEGMQLGIKNMIRPVSQEGQRMAMAAIPDTASMRSAAGSATAGVGAGGAAGAGASVLSVTMNVSIDDLAKLSKLADFLEMLENARVDARRTLNSGTVTA